MAVYKFSTNSLKTPLKYSSLLAGNAVFVPWEAASAYDSIATTTLSTTSASVTFSSIPATYKHLQIRMLAKSNYAGNEDGYVRFNGDTASNYSWHFMYGDGGTAGAYSGTSSGFIRGFRQVGNSSSANVFDGTVIDILDYANTSKYKTLRSSSGYDNNGSGMIQFQSGLWMSTAATTSITLTTETGSSFMAYSSFALYGIKGE